MDKKQLKTTLRQLHKELESVEKVDPNTLELLHTLTDDIDTVLERSEKAKSGKNPADNDPEEESPIQGLRDLLLQFETEHPQLSETLGRIADGLSRMGI